MRKQPFLCGGVWQVEMGLLVARMRENRNAHRVLIGKLKESHFEGRPKHR
jgi:hypothetical protein